MRKLFLLLLLITGAKTLPAQQLNLSLKKELDSLFIQDQKWRELLSSNDFQKNQDSLANLFHVERANLMMYVIDRMNKSDSMNMKRIDEIIAQHGYPGRSLVGEQTNEAAFFIIQHSQKINQYLPAIKKAADAKELSFTLYAMMLDRSLMYNNKPQIYGTQVKGVQITDQQNGSKKFIRFVWPIENPEKVNERRMQAGFTTTVEENAKRLNVEYKVLTMEEVQKMQQ